MTKQNATQTPNSILIEGAPEGRRYTIVIDSKRITLSTTSFRLFATLALCRWHDHVGGGWVNKSEFGLSDGNESAYCYVLRRDIECALGGRCEWIPIESDRKGNWRICAPADVLRFDLANLRSFPDHRMTRYLPGECHCTERIE